MRSLSLNRLNLGHPQDRQLGALRLIEHSIEAQLEFEHQLSEQDKREIELAKCFPEGKLILRGILWGFEKTLDSEVFRSYVVQDGVKKGILYINLVRKRCVAIDSLA